MKNAIAGAVVVFVLALQGPVMFAQSATERPEIVDAALPSALTHVPPGKRVLDLTGLGDGKASDARLVKLAERAQARLGNLLGSRRCNPAKGCELVDAAAVIVVMGVSAEGDSARVLFQVVIATGSVRMPVTEEDVAVDLKREDGKWRVTKRTTLRIT